MCQRSQCPPPLIKGCGTKLPEAQRLAAIRAGLSDYIDDVTVGESQFLYKCERTCVGYGPPSAYCHKEVPLWSSGPKACLISHRPCLVIALLPCNRPAASLHPQNMICSEVDLFGPIGEQFDSLKGALLTPAKVHPRCPMRGVPSCPLPQPEAVMVGTPCNHVSKGSLMTPALLSLLCLPFVDDHYPINMLRNVAQQHVATAWHMALDIDVIPSACMESHIEVCGVVTE